MQRVAFLLLLLVVSCGEVKYPGYTLSDNGLYYKFIALSDCTTTPSKGDFVKLLCRSHTLKGEPLQLDSLISFEVREIADGDMQEAISMMSVGDSASFIVKRSIKGEQKNVRLTMRLDHLLTKEDVKRENELLKYLADKEKTTVLDISKNLIYNDLYAFTFTKNLYVQALKSGAGEKPVEGDIVYIHYTGSFLNGKVFDSTYERKEALQFEIGQPDQVIKGLETAVQLLSEGGKAKFIIPSQLAFGEAGSSTGIVPPSTPVIYEVELLKIIKQ